MSKYKTHLVNAFWPLICVIKKKFCQNSKLKGSDGAVSPQPRGTENNFQWDSKGGGGDCEKGTEEGATIFMEGRKSLKRGQKSLRRGA